MQLAYSSPIFCSFGVRGLALWGYGRCFQNLLQMQAVQLIQLGKAAIEA
jgi:hypothetical protein